MRLPVVGVKECSDSVEAGIWAHGVVFNDITVQEVWGDSPWVRFG